MHTSEAARSRPTPWNTVILLCGKCARKMEGGYGVKGKETLRSVLRAELKIKGYGRGIRLIETRCMGLCPKNEVTVLNAGRPDCILTVPKGVMADQLIEQILRPDRDLARPAEPAAKTYGG